jgi:hypothetical protein
MYTGAHDDSSSRGRVRGGEARKLHHGSDLPPSVTPNALSVPPSSSTNSTRKTQHPSNDAHPQDFVPQSATATAGVVSRVEESRGVVNRAAAVGAADGDIHSDHAADSGCSSDTHTEETESAAQQMMAAMRGANLFEQNPSLFFRATSLKKGRRFW